MMRISALVRYVKKSIGTELGLYDGGGTKQVSVKLI